MGNAIESCWGAGEGHAQGASRAKGSAPLVDEFEVKRQQAVEQRDAVDAATQQATQQQLAGVEEALQQVKSAGESASEKAKETVGQAARSVEQASKDTAEKISLGVDKASAELSKAAKSVVASADEGKDTAQVPKDSDEVEVATNDSSKPVVETAVEAVEQQVDKSGTAAVEASSTLPVEKSNENETGAQAVQSAVQEDSKAETLPAAVQDTLSAAPKAEEPTKAAEVASTEKGVESTSLTETTDIKDAAITSDNITESAGVQAPDAPKDEVAPITNSSEADGAAVTTDSTLTDVPAVTTAPKTASTAAKKPKKKKKSKKRK